MSRKNVRVVIPRNADELIELGESIVAKHNEDPATSPLAGLDMAAFETVVTAASAKSTEVKQLRKDAETATEDRDTLLGHRKDQNTNTVGTVLNFVVRSREILLGSYKGTEQKLGDFGFEVNQSSSSSSNNVTPASVGTVSGIVSDTDNNPISGVSVGLKDVGVAVLTNSAGEYTLPNVTYANYTLVASAPNLKMVEIPITVNSESITQNITLTKI